MEVAYDPNGGTWLYVLCIEYVGLTEAGASLAGHQVECRWYNGDDMGGRTQPFTLDGVGSFAKIFSYSYFVISHSSLEERPQYLALTISMPDDGGHIAAAYPLMCYFSVDDNPQSEDVELQMVDGTPGTAAIIRIHTRVQARWVPQPGEVLPQPQGCFVEAAADHQAAMLHVYLSEQAELTQEATTDAGADGTAEPAEASPPQLRRQEAQEPVAHEAEPAAEAGASAEAAPGRGEQSRTAQEHAQRAPEPAGAPPAASAAEAAEGDDRAGQRRQWEQDRASLRQEAFREQARLREARDRQRKSLIESLVAEVKGSSDKDDLAEVDRHPRPSDTDSDAGWLTRRARSTGGPHVDPPALSPAGLRGESRPLTARSSGSCLVDEGRPASRGATDAKANEAQARGAGSRGAAAGGRDEGRRREPQGPSRRGESDSDASESCCFEYPAGTGGEDTDASAKPASNGHFGRRGPARHERAQLRLHNCSGSGATAAESSSGPGWAQAPPSARAPSGAGRPARDPADGGAASGPARRSPRSHSAGRARAAETPHARPAQGLRMRPPSVPAACPRSSSEVLAAALTDLKELSPPGFDNVAAVEESVLRLLALRRELAGRAPGCALGKAAGGLAPGMLQLLEAARGICEENNSKFRSLCEERNVSLEQFGGDARYMESQLGMLRGLEERVSQIQCPSRHGMPGAARPSRAGDARSPSGSPEMHRGTTPRPLDPGADGPQRPILRSGTSPRTARPTDSAPQSARSRSTTAAVVRPSANAPWQMSAQEGGSFGWPSHLSHVPVHHGTSAYVPAERYWLDDVGTDRPVPWSAEHGAHVWTGSSAPLTGGRHGAGPTPRAAPRQAPLRAAMQQLRDVSQATAAAHSEALQYVRGSSRGPDAGHAWGHAARREPAAGARGTAPRTPRGGPPLEDKYLKILQNLQVKSESGNSVASHILESSGLTPRRSGDSEYCRTPYAEPIASTAQRRAADVQMSRRR